MSEMTFYEELKQLRIQQKIDLSEVANRTKINIGFLESIESGDFTFLPHVYVRLFIRAYVIEIGADPDDALNQYEIFLSNSGKKLPERLEIDTQVEPVEVPSDQDDDEDIPQKTPFQSRSDWIKAGVLVALLLFAIFIIQKITTDQEVEIKPEFSSSTHPIPITDEFLLNTYSTEVQSTILDVHDPYQFSLKATIPVWYEYTLDQFPPTSSNLVKGGEIIMDFKSSMKLRLNHSNEIDFRINSQPILLTSYDSPVDLSFDSGTGQVLITQYFPK